MVVEHVPCLFPGEVLSSLIIRLARNHVSTPHELCTLLWPDFQFWTRDIDRSASDELLSAIAETTGLGIDALRQSTLRGLVHSMGFRERIEGKQDGILPVGVYHRIRRHHGQQFCPVCLAEKPAYLHKLWRLEFLVACPEHEILLRDACPHCDSPFIPHRQHALDEHVCHRCSQSLISGNTSVLSRYAAFLQGSILAALSAMSDEVARAPGAAEEPVYMGMQITAPEYIDGIRRLCRLATFHTYQAQNPGTHRRRTWDILRTTERAAVMDIVGLWIADWPNSWLQWALSHHLTRRHVEYLCGPWPSWVSAAKTALPYSPMYVGRRRKRKQTTLRQFRRRQANVARYREARAHHLLGKASVLQVIEK